jgi:alanine dehydrogenase
MQIIDAATVVRLLDYPSLVDALGEAFRSGCTMPLRHHHHIEVPGAADASLLLMPAWRAGEYLGVKIVTVFPGNASTGKPTVGASYILYDANDGRMLAMIDGETLTARRTAAASVLAARSLARKNAARLLIVGTGTIAGSLPRAYTSVFPKLNRIAIWGRQVGKAEALVATLRAEGLPAEAALDLEPAVRTSDIISCATLSQTPLIKGAWLRSGQHIDLVGGFTPTMREADDDAVAKAQVFVDTYDGAMNEAGDIVQPLRTGRLKREAIADLASLVRGDHPGRTDDQQITLFKSVGTALEDLAAAVLVYRRKS